MVRKMVMMYVIGTMFLRFVPANGTVEPDSLNGVDARVLSQEETDWRVSLVNEAIKMSADRDQEIKRSGVTLLERVLGPLSTQEAWDTLNSIDSELGQSPVEVLADKYPGADPMSFFGKFIRRRVDVPSLQLSDRDHL